MRRRGFLGALAALALSRPLARVVPAFVKRMARTYIVVHPGDSLSAALAEVSKAGGGQVFLMPGHYENHGPL